MKKILITLIAITIFNQVLFCQKDSTGKKVEEKIVEMRKKYFQLKYADVLTLFRENIFMPGAPVAGNETL